MAIEIKINKEIHQYKESMFFGLTLRQFTCSALAVGIAVAAYFYFRPLLGDEAVSWICIFGACPMAVAGFFHYNGMTLEKTLWAMFKSQVLLAGKRVWKAENYYWQAIQLEEGRQKKRHEHRENKDKDEDKNRDTGRPKVAVDVEENEHGAGRVPYTEERPAERADPADL